MKTINQNTHASKESVKFLPGSTLESVGVFFMQQLKHIPIDICERCLNVLAAEIGRLEVRQQINPMPKEAYKMKRLSLDLKVIYYKHCRTLTLKHQSQ
jgi:hypothetical protein